ncbi:YtxH domain-containing protein [Sporolactobacillus sp. CQH2019]|uniref:YtxH domain-containing protein n=1 Tax=Sporolactobacillus sp. CQH2019 TaxID=3023512 RepID=UPI0023678D56|nr:YtxH domain-containing protein [Sporolactobacillus sp. CQH2019]MDD9147222.1 YtxH domain-containing protein [Sporolactobacillus sp. CQH2019]
MATENEKKSCSGLGAKELFIGGVIGGMIGAAAALFLAPRSGEELRRDLCANNAIGSGIEKIKQAASNLIKKDSEPYS